MDITKKKNLILDLGGVILTIDYKRTIAAFKNLGIKDAESLYSQQSQTELFDLLEKGLISETDFYNELRKLSGNDHSDEELKDCWNQILIDLPEENVAMLQQLRLKYRLFLLSNTNSIHEVAYRKMISDKYGRYVFDDLFEKMYLSHQIHLRKPAPEIFNYVLEDKSLVREECLFVDDSIQHIDAARKLGIDSVLMPAGRMIDSAFKFI